MLVLKYQTTWRHVPEDRDLQYDIIIGPAFRVNLSFGQSLFRVALKYPRNRPNLQSIILNILPASVKHFA